MPAKMRGGVPRPARIVEDRPGERDEVRIARSDDRLGLLIVGDQPDRDDRDRYRLLDLPRERDLVAGADRNVPIRTQTAA